MPFQKTDNVLLRRPEARGIRVEKLVQEAIDGRLRVPSFQRPLRWKSKHVIEFFDSIRRGFPIGSLLLSREQGPTERINFGSCSLDVQERQDALWVIDGQQRVTALVATLQRPEAVPRGDYWAVWYDLEYEQFMRNAGLFPGVSWIPLNVVNNSVSLLRWIRNWIHADDNPIWVERALELGKAIREYELPAYIVEGADQTLLRLIFTRANTAGVGMRESEIFEARYGKEGERPIRSAVARLKQTGFGILDEDLFLRCLRAICGDSGKTSTESPEGLASDVIARTEQTLRRVFRTMQLYAGIPHWKLLPYQMPLIFLSAFYDRFPQENERVDRMAATWVWQGASRGNHQDSTDAYIRRMLKTISQEAKPDSALAGLLRATNPEEVLAIEERLSSEFDRPISLNRATGKVFVLGLLAARTMRITKSSDLDFEAEIEQDLDSEQNGLTDYEGGRLGVQEAPVDVDLKRLLRPIFGDEKSGTNVVIRQEGLGPAEILNMSADRTYLSSHLLNERCVELFKEQRLDEFCVERRGLLSQYFHSFILDRLGDVNDHRPSITSIAEAPSIYTIRSE